MFDTFLSDVDVYVQSSPWLAFAAVFLGGLLTATNPCVLAMIPLMMSYVAGRREEGSGAWRAFGFSAVFVLGLSVTFTVLGLVAALAGQAYEGVSPVWNGVVAVVCLVMGLHLTGLVHVPIPAPAALPRRFRGLLGAFVLGLLFGVVSAPCAAPILVVILVYLSGADASPAYGAALLLTYGIGHSVLLLVAGTSVGLARRLLASAGFQRSFDLLRRGAGVVIILVGAWFALSAFQGPTAPRAAGSGAAPTVAHPVDRVVFVGQEECCECTHERIEASWLALLEAVGDDGPSIERLQSDVDAEKVGPLQDLRPILVIPALYFLDREGRLVDQLQGELDAARIRAVLTDAP